MQSIIKRGTITRTINYCCIFSCNLKIPTDGPSPGWETGSELGAAAQLVSDPGAEQMYAATTPPPQTPPHHYKLYPTN